MKREYRIGFKIALIIAIVESLFWFVWHFFAPLPEITKIVFLRDVNNANLLWWSCGLPFTYQPWWMDAVLVILLSWPMTALTVWISRIIEEDVGFAGASIPVVIYFVVFMYGAMAILRPISTGFIAIFLLLGSIVIPICHAVYWIGFGIYLIVEAIFTMPMWQAIGRWIVK